MLKACSTSAAFALIAVLAAPADAQSPTPWTEAGMLRCLVNPSIGFIVAGHQSMECTFTQNAPIPPQAYYGALNMIGLNIGISAGGVFGWAVLGAHGWHTGRSARWRICRRQRGHRPRPWRRRKRPDRGFWAHVCPCSPSRWKVRLPSTSRSAFPHSNCGRCPEADKHRHAISQGFDN